AVARLRHPHIVQVHAWEESDAGPVLVMEFVPGGSLEEWLAGRTLPSADAARLVAGPGRAGPAAAGRRGGPRGREAADGPLPPPVAGNAGTVAGVFPKLTDFGLASLAGQDAERLTTPGLVIGTPSYLPPEQADGRADEAGPKADVWALGVILYRCLSGRVP